MVTKVLKRVEDIESLTKFILARDSFPITVTITKGASRADAQNRLAQKWNSDIARQLEDDTFDAIRAYNKLHFGIPILLSENEAFGVEYDRVMGRLGYEEKLAAISAFDLPVTRILTVKQMTAYLDAVQRHWTQQGFWLTSPDDLGRQEGF